MFMKKIMICLAVAAAVFAALSPENGCDRLIDEAHPLPPEYEPDDLTFVRHARAGREKLCRMRKDAAKAVDEMLDEACSQGFPGLSVTNGYRSYAYQKYLYYEYYPQKEMRSCAGLSYQKALERVSRYCKAPGESEHQSGLGCDIHDLPIGKQEQFSGTPAAEWLEQNAHRFGFILRYPRGKENVTGTVYEPWHYRYVGRSAAAFVYENGITLEEYALLAEKD